MKLRNQSVEDRRTFFFGDHIKILRKLWQFFLKTFFLWRSHQNPEKTVAFFIEDLFFFCFGYHIKIRTKLWHFSLKNFFFVFGGHIRIRTKLWHFPRLCWSSQNRRRVILELTPGPCLTLGAHGVLERYGT